MAEDAQRNAPPVESAASSAEVFAGGRAPQMTDLWRALTRCERAALVESSAIREHRFDQLEPIWEALSAELSHLQELALALGVDRRNADFRQRMEAMERAQQRNLEFLKQLSSEFRRESEDLLAARRRLQLLREVYASGKEHTFLEEG